MINDIFAFWVGPLEWLVIIVTVGIPVLLIILFFRLFLRNRKENIRLRLEVGKLADELEQVRKKAQDGEKGDPSAKSR